MNTFCLISHLKMGPHWFMRLTTIEELQVQAQSYYRDYWNGIWYDPHFQRFLEQGNLDAALRHPNILLPKRIISILRCIFVNGAVYLNRRGGWMFPCSRDQIIETRECDGFPGENLEESSNMPRIYIHPARGKFYMFAWPATIVFTKSYFDTQEEAFAEAKRHVKETRVRISEEAHERFIYAAEHVTTNKQN